MKFSLSWLKEFVDIKESPEKLAELLTLRSFEVSEWHKSATSGEDDIILEIDILPNRPDALSHYGLAREVAVITDRKFKAPQSVVLSEAEDLNIKKLLDVKVKNYDLCPRYTARIIEGVKVGDSPIWLKKRLELLGLKSINNIVDATNYVMLELGQPLHAFDYDRLSEKEKKVIIVDKAIRGEKIKVLDEAGTEFTLDSDILTIRNEKDAIALAGIKGGKGSEIVDSTKNIVIESANFSPSNTRLSSKKINLTTDASVRFSYGVDFNLAPTALDRVAVLIQELAGGKIVRGMIDEHSKKPITKTVAVEKEYISKLSGVKIENSFSANALKALGFEVQDKKDKFVVTVPSFRLDISDSEDVVEEITRLYGYENIKSEPPLVGAFTDIPFSRGVHLTKYGETELWDFAESIKFRDLVKNIFVGLGFSEVYNYTFISEEDKELYSYKTLIEINNPISHYARYLRPNLATNLLKAAQNNLKFFPDVRLFEIGRVFSPNENRRLGGIIAVKRGSRGFFELKGLIDSFLNSLGLASQHYDDITTWHDADKSIFHPGISAEIKLNEEVIGAVGEISPNVLYSLGDSSAGIFKNTAVAAFEVDFQKLISLVQSEREYQPIAKFPSIIRDISLLVDKEVRISQILNRIEGADTKRIVSDTDVFDIYEDEPSLPEGKKSITFRVIYQSPERTLTDKEVDEIEENIKKVLAEGLGAEIR